jgi:peroxiredoxin
MASTDEERVNRGFAEKNGATFPILSDPDKRVCKDYGVLYPIGLAKRWTFYIGPEGLIQRIDKQVKPRTAGSQLVQNLLDLQVPMSGGE